VHLQSKATTDYSTIFDTHVFSLYSRPCIYDLYIYIVTHLHTVYLNWLQAVLESNLRCTWKQWLSELREPLWGIVSARLGMHLEDMVKWPMRCTPRPWLYKCGDALGGRDLTSLVISTRRSWFCNIGGCNRVSMEMHLDTMVMRTGRPQWRRFGDPLEGGDRANLEIPLEAVIDWNWMSTWRRSMDSAANSETLFITVLTCNCANVTMWRFFWAIMQCWQMAVDRVGKHDRSESDIEGPFGNHQNECKTNHLRWMLYSVYTVHGVSCTRCMLYSVCTVLTVYWTRCMQYSVYPVLGVNSWSEHGKIERDNITLCSCDHSRLVDEQERWEMKMGMIWRIRANMTNQGYKMANWVYKTSYQWYYSADRHSYLPYPQW